MDKSQENADCVKAFNNELASLYECKPPVSKAKMVQITKTAMKAIKYYKHVVLSVEKFIQKCRPEYKLPGLYVIDSIVRQSRHQYGVEKDLFAPRFSKNMSVTFQSLFKCSDEDKQRIVRVVRLWSKNHVFPEDDLKPVLDMASAFGVDMAETTAERNGSKGVVSKKNNTPSPMETSSPNVLRVMEFPEMVRTQQASSGKLDPSMFSQIQKFSTALGSSQQPVKAEPDRKLTEKLLAGYEYSDEESGGEDSAGVSHRASDSSSRNDLSANLAAAAENLLKNPKLLQQIHQMQQSIKGQTSQLQAGTGLQTLQGLHQHPQPPSALNVQQSSPPPQPPFIRSYENQVSSYPPPAEPVPPPMADPSAFGSRMNWPANPAAERLLDRDERKRGSEVSNRRSRSRSKDRRRRASRSRSGSREAKKRNRSRSTERRNREYERERKKQGLPPMKPKHISICSRTLWFGRVPAYCEADEIKEGLKDYGEPVSIDLITPRGCAYVVMPDRKLAFKVLDRLRDSLKVQNRTLKMAWAPGRGVKEYKDGWVVDHGVTYLPWDCLPSDLTSLLDGGSLDVESLPDHLKGIYSETGKLETPLPTNQTIPHPFTLGPPPFPGLAGVPPGAFPAGILPPAFAPSMVPAPVPNPSATGLRPGQFGLNTMPPPPMPLAPPSMVGLNPTTFGQSVPPIIPSPSGTAATIPSLLSTPVSIYGQSAPQFGQITPSYAHRVGAPEPGHGRAGFFSSDRSSEGGFNAPTRFRGRGRGGRDFGRGRPFRGGGMQRRDWPPPPNRYEPSPRNGRPHWQTGDGDDRGRSDFNNDNGARSARRSRWNTESDDLNESATQGPAPTIEPNIHTSTARTDNDNISNEPPPPGE